MKFPIQSHSWEVLSPSVAIKRMDKSAFLHHGTGIPRDIIFFFELDSESQTTQRPIELLCDGNHFPAHFQMDAQHSRYRLFWKADFSRTIERKFPNIHRAYSSGGTFSDEAPLMRFEKENEARYRVDLILAAVIAADVAEEVLQESESEARTEGGVHEYYGKRYERDPANRRAAIAYHGLRCKACNFSFEEAYGDRGEGFIEIHHNKPLSATGEEQPVDPRTDLVPLCANCHRMIHRFRDEVISVEELRKIIGLNKALDGKA